MLLNANYNATYHAPIFEPTVDELATLKHLEIENISVISAMKEHMSGRLYEHGYIAKNASGQLSITETGRHLVRRQNN
ncbi:hypothetical protein [Acidovorax sp.]|jgi:hypothetical protein|uniref:hypothetical protein n=1 Tax=Acidovorax sp. TaxID=1872122 RepID=UPI00391F4E13